MLKGSTAGTVLVLLCATTAPKTAKSPQRLHTARKVRNSPEPVNSVLRSPRAMSEGTGGERV